MSKGNQTEADTIAYFFNATAFPWAAITELYIALYTADPGEAGTATTNEATFTSYARVATDRDGTGWTCTGNSATNAAQIQFPACTGGSNTITHFGIVTTASGAGQILYSGALSDIIAVSNTIRVIFDAGELVLSED